MTEPVEAAAPVPSVYELFLALQRAVKVVEKSSRNTDAEFDYRSIEDVMNVVGAAQRQLEHGVLIIPNVVNLRTERYRTTQGRGMKCAEVRVEYTVYGPRGDSFTGSAYGEAASEGDKAIAAAQSVAFRTFLTHGLTIPTKQFEPDSVSHERAGADESADAARAEMLELIRCNAADEADYHEMRARAAEEFASANNGLDIKDCLDPVPIRELTADLRLRLESAPV
ncbi:ERF family protein [Nocardia gipuzkoensis]|uniref:ERF family protein n=1 Tax=Nocardia gipuzkoensis TaxID=2749991 RepID=UPI00237D90D3|nr:ERF family protein [Nocardia gipuzkoensis]MDE1673742.1 ERF family protein [Nocardia gipuzkoensis]